MKTYRVRICFGLEYEHATIFFRVNTRWKDIGERNGYIRLCRATKVTGMVKNISASLLCGVAAGICTKICTDTKNVSALVVIFFAIYSCMLYIVSTPIRSDLRWTASLCKGD